MRLDARTLKSSILAEEQVPSSPVHYIGSWEAGKTPYVTIDRKEVTPQEVVDFLKKEDGKTPDHYKIERNGQTYYLWNDPEQSQVDFLKKWVSGGDNRNAFMLRGLSYQHLNIDSQSKIPSKKPWPPQENKGLWNIMTDNILAVRSRVLEAVAPKQKYVSILANWDSSEGKFPEFMFEGKNLPLSDVKHTCGDNILSERYMIRHKGVEYNIFNNPSSAEEKVIRHHGKQGTALKKIGDISGLQMDLSASGAFRLSKPGETQGKGWLSEMVTSLKSWGTGLLETFTAKVGLYGFGTAGKTKESTSKKAETVVEKLSEIAALIKEPVMPTVLKTVQLVGNFNEAVFELGGCPVANQNIKRIYGKGAAPDRYVIETENRRYVLWNSPSETVRAVLKKNGKIHDAGNVSGTHFDFDDFEAQIAKIQIQRNCDFKNAPDPVREGISSTVSTIPEIVQKAQAKIGRSAPPIYRMQMPPKKNYFHLCGDFSDTELLFKGQPVPDMDIKKYSKTPYAAARTEIDLGKNIIVLWDNPTDAQRDRIMNLSREDVFLNLGNKSAGKALELGDDIKGSDDFIRERFVANVVSFDRPAANDDNIFSVDAFLSGERDDFGYLEDPSGFLSGEDGEFCRSVVGLGEIDQDVDNVVGMSGWKKSERPMVEDDGTFMDKMERVV